MNTYTIRYLAGKYRLLPEKRGEILRDIYLLAGKSGMQALANTLNKNLIQFLEWIKADIEYRNRCRRGKRRSTPPDPPAPSRVKDIKIQEIFDESQYTSSGNKTGKQGGKRSIYNGLAWDAVSGGGK